MKPGEGVTILPEYLIERRTRLLSQTFVRTRTHSDGTRYDLWTEAEPATVDDFITAALELSDVERRAIIRALSRTLSQGEA